MASNVQISDEELTADPVLKERARKRQAIGLSAQRPTAKPMVQRPPDAGQSDGLMRLAIALLLVMVVATLTMVVDAVSGEPIRRALSESQASGILVQDAFETPVLALAEREEAGRWATGFAPGVYRITVEQPGNLAWSTLGMLNLGPYRLAAEATVAQETPWGYSGLLARYQNDENFYLFAVDGQGAYQVQLQKEGKWRTLQPWTAADALHAAGQTNHLELEDDGSQLRFLGNGEALFTVSGARLPTGEAGLAGGARSQGSAQVDFDSLTVSAIPLKRN